MCVFILIPASRRALEEQIQRFKSEKSEVKTELHLLEERCSTLENELEKEQQNNNSLTEAKADVEVGIKMNWQEE